MKKKLIISIGTVLIIMAVIFCIWLFIRPNIVSSHYLEAQSLMDKKEYELCQKELDNIYKIDSRFLDAYTLNYKLLLVTNATEKEIYDFTEKAYKKTKNSYFENLSKDYMEILKTCDPIDLPKLNFPSGIYNEEFFVKITNQVDNESYTYRLNDMVDFYSGAISIKEGRNHLTVYKHKMDGNHAAEYVYYVGEPKDNIDLSHNDGVYEDEFSLSLSSKGDIYYTLDGREPSIKTEHYDSPIKISHNTILKYFYKIDGVPSQTFTNYYYFKDNSLSANSTSKIEQTSENIYINSDKGFSLYNGKKLLTPLSVSDICCSNDEVFFISRDYNNGIYKVSKDGGIHRCIFDKDASLLKNSGNFLFYIDSSDKSLWLCDNNGKNSRKLYENVSSYTLKNDYVYFLRNNTLYKSKLFSNDCEKLLENIKEFDVSNDGKIYYIKNEGGLYVNENGVESPIAEGNVITFALSPFDGKVCYNKDDTLYFENQEIDKGFIYSISFSKNSINYYIIDEKDEKIKTFSLSDKK